MLIENLELFLRILEKGSMAAAGRELGLSAPTVTARLSALESHFGVELLHRTTRSLSPTTEGAKLREAASELLEELRALEANLRNQDQRLSGKIRLSAPSDLGRNWLVPILDAFGAEHEDVQIDLHLSDGYVDLSRHSVDVALRYGRLKDSSLRVRKLASVRRILCAAPAYLEKHCVPRHPAELTEHDCLLLRFGDDAEMHWSFLEDGKEVTRSIVAKKIANDGEVVRRWCIAGHGIARKSELDIHQDLATGRLVPLLEDFEVPPVDLQLVYPQGRFTPSRIQALTKTLLQATLPCPAG